MSALNNTLFVDTASISIMAATGSLFGTSSWANNAVTATTATTATSATTANTAVAATSASWASASFSSSYATTSSFALVANSVLGSITSASYAVTASFYQLPTVIQAGIASSSVFSGTPLIYPVTLSVSMPNAIYSISIIGGDARSWTAEQISASSFIISTNSSQALTDYVRWTAIGNGVTL